MKKILSLLIALMFLGGCATDTAVEDATGTTDTTVQETTQEETPDTEESAEPGASESGTDSAAETIEVSTTFEINGETEDELTGTYEVEAGTTLLDFMKDEFEVEESDGFIESINGYSQDPEANVYWLYEINSEMVSVGAAEYVLEAGDNISWTLNPLE